MLFINSNFILQNPYFSCTSKGETLIFLLQILPCLSFGNNEF